VQGVYINHTMKYTMHASMLAVEFYETQHNIQKIKVYMIKIISSSFRKHIPIWSLMLMFSREGVQELMNNNTLN
jgi:hypothetical protein